MILILLVFGLWGGICFIGGKSTIHAHDGKKHIEFTKETDFEKAADRCTLGLSPEGNIRCSELTDDQWLDARRRHGLVTAEWKVKQNRKAIWGSEKTEGGTWKQ